MTLLFSFAIIKLQNKLTKKSMNYTNEQIKNFTELSAEYTAGAMDLDNIMNELGVVSYDSEGLGASIDEMNLLSEDFDYSAGAELMKKFNVKF